MTSQYQPILVGFENAEAINTLLERVGLAPDLGAFLSEHLQIVLRQQYADLDIEFIEFVKACNCNADGVPALKSNILKLSRLSIPFDANVVVTARKQRYKLRLDVIINATLAGESYNVSSDVKIRGQTF